MLKIYNSNQAPEQSRTIWSCLKKRFKTFQAKPVTSEYHISAPIHNYARDMNAKTIEYPAYAHFRRTDHNGDWNVPKDSCYMHTDTETREPCIRRMVAKASEETWDQKERLDGNTTILCLREWTGIDPYDFHTQELRSKDMETAQRLRDFSQDHRDLFAEFEIFTIPIEGRAEHHKAGWARCGLPLNLALAIAVKLDVLSSPLRDFIASKVGTALRLYEYNQFPLPDVRSLKGCFEIWREESQTFSLKFSMPDLYMKSATDHNPHTTVNNFQNDLKEIFSNFPPKKEDRQGSDCSEMINKNLRSIYAHKNVLFPGGKLTSIA